MANPTAIPTPTPAPGVRLVPDLGSAQAVDEDSELFEVASEVAVADAATVVVTVWPAEFVTVADWIPQAVPSVELGTQVTAGVALSFVTRTWPLSTKIASFACWQYCQWHGEVHELFTTTERVPSPPRLRNSSTAFISVGPKIHTLRNLLFLAPESHQKYITAWL